MGLNMSVSYLAERLIREAGCVILNFLKFTDMIIYLFIYYFIFIFIFNGAGGGGGGGGHPARLSNLQ